MPPKKKKAAEDSDGDGAPKSPVKPPAKKAKPNAGPIPRDDTPRPEPLPEGTPYFKALSWNVNGLRAVVGKSHAVLQALVDAEKPHLLCLQETKLQEKDTAALDDTLAGGCCAVLYASLRAPLAALPPVCFLAHTILFRRRLHRVLELVDGEKGLCRYGGVHSYEGCAGQGCCPCTGWWRQGQGQGQGQGQSGGG